MTAPETYLFGGDKTKDTALAELLGVAPSTIGRWRKDASKIPLGMAQKLALIQGGVLTFKRTEREYE